MRNSKNVPTLHSSSKASLPIRPLQTVALVAWLVLTLAQLGRLPSHESLQESLHEFVNPITTPTPPPKKRRLAVVNFLDNQPKSLWGIYSIHHQLKKFNMTPSVTHMVLVASDLHQEYKDMLVDWIGEENVRETDKKYIRRKLPKKKGLWPQVFSKLEAFNLTEFDKLILLDNDIFIRRNLMHWFDYPAPAATPTRGAIEWNSGAMVIEPDEELYNTLLDYLPRTRAWAPYKSYRKDPWNSGMGHQGFLSAFFTSNATNHTMHTMNYACSVLSSDLVYYKENRYFFKYRRDTIETLHMTMHKPWRKNKESSRVICPIFAEWMESISDLDDSIKDKLPVLPDFCGYSGYKLAVSEEDASGSQAK